MIPSATAEFELVRAATLLDSDPAAAARAASAVLAVAPGHEHAALLLASACHRLGNSATAAPVLEALAADHADSPVIQFELGRCRAADRRTQEAIAAFSRVVASYG